MMPSECASLKTSQMYAHAESQLARAKSDVTAGGWDATFTIGVGKIVYPEDPYRFGDGSEEDQRLRPWSSWYGRG